MRAAGFWSTAVACMLAAAAGWAAVKRDRVIFRGGIAGTLFCWLLAFTSFIENCGGGGDCETYANWPESKAAAVAGVPPLITGLIAALASGVLKNKVRSPE